MADAVASLPWVEPQSIRAVRASRQVKFTLTDRAKFDDPAVTDAIRRAGYDRARLLVGPTEPTPAPPKGQSP